MRRLFLVVMLGTLIACSTPPITFGTTFKTGAVYRYALTTTSHTAFAGGSGTRNLTATLEADTEIRVERAGPDAIIFAITITPTAATRDGDPIDPPEQQLARVEAAPDGALRRVLAEDGENAIDAFTVADLAGIFGPVLPAGRHRLGDRWVTTSDATEHRGRVVSLRRTDGIDSVVLALQAVRTVERRRTLEGRPLTLEGIERTSTSMDRAIEGGYPIRTRTLSVASLTVRSGTLVGGTVEIDATTELTLREYVPA